MSAETKVYALCGKNCRHETLTKEQIYAAIAEYAETGTFSDKDTGFITTIKTINGAAIKFFAGTAAAYNELTEEEKENLFAIITNDATITTLFETVGRIETALEGLQEVLRDGSFIVKGAEEAATADKLKKTLLYQNADGLEVAVLLDDPIPLDHSLKGKTIEIWYSTEKAIGTNTSAGKQAVKLKVDPDMDITEVYFFKGVMFGEDEDGTERLFYVEQRINVGTSSINFANLARPLTIDSTGQVTKGNYAYTHPGIYYIHEIYEME